ncbi:MAG: glycosyltransferase family 1 protein, partial [Chloroflexi bacterium]|nr:glycosyltransferase family 1 protein [Chloroflexota bacterium]
MKILLLTLGSQGDVQPFVALGVGLQAAGAQVTLATGRSFEPLVRRYGLQFAPLRADFLQLAQSAEGKAALAGKNPVAMLQKVLPELRQSLQDAWQAAQGAECIVYHPKALAGYHIAEKLGIPAFLSLPLPLYTPTGAFAVPVLPGAPQLGGLLNRLSYALVLAASTAPYRSMLARWRQEELGLPARWDERRLGGRPVPRLYAYSRHVVPVPADWDASSQVTGYWFLPPAVDWQPDPGLVDFLAAGPPPVYVGFGSMTVAEAARLTGVVVEAVRQAGVRAVLASGWGGLAPGDLPDGIWPIPSAPHEWLFPRLAAVVHHGGAGTTAAGLRAGKP